MTTTMDIEVRRAVAMVQANFGLPDVLPTVYRLLAEGEPVSVQRLAAAGGWPVADVRAELDRHRGVDWDERGRIVGFGVSLRPTPHVFRFDGGTLYGFCATGVLELPIILGVGGTGESTCPATGRTISVELTPDEVVAVDPAAAVVSKVRPGEAVADVRAEICNLGNFFGSLDAAAGWLTRNPRGDVDPVATEFAITRHVLTHLGWSAPS